MARKYVIKAIAGKYMKDGEEKIKYIEIGAIMDGKNGGFVMHLDAVPTGWDGWAFLSEPEARGNKGYGTGGAGQARPKPQPGARTQAGLGDELDDDIPF